MSSERFPTAVAKFGQSAKSKLANPAVYGEPEDQLRSPVEELIKDLAVICGFPREDVTPVGESSLSSLKTRPDYAVTVRGVLVGFIEIKAPGKGGDPRKFKSAHDKQQWEKLKSLPNLIYTDGNEFSLWRNGELEGDVIRLEGDVETSGDNLEAPTALFAVFEAFLRWQPLPPKNAKELAGVTARLCRLLREEVTEQLGEKSPALTALAEDWRHLLFPEATDEQFADGYAQVVTFGLLVARARGISLKNGLGPVAQELAQTNTLIGSALRLLTDNAVNQSTLSTSLSTLTRVLDAVYWETISRNEPDAWLYFYEEFLSVYDNELRKKTGSYYTPPQVVSAMVRLVDEALRIRFHAAGGLASPSVTVADPAVGTGTFLLGVLARIAETTRLDEGQGAVAAAINAAIKRIVGFEIQLGPFAVAQLRILAELKDLIGSDPNEPLRMFVSDTLSDPYGKPGWLPAILAPIAESRKRANQVKLSEPITVIIGNPPYKEKAKGRGSWVESGSGNSPEPAPLESWMPPADWGVSAHAKHLRNLYVYFWRWATWKVFDHDPAANSGIVCFITVSGFLNGPGFEKMRDYLRRKADEIWVIDCSPEGHQPNVPTRIFQGVQQPVCIVLASRSPRTKEGEPATARFTALPVGRIEDKFAALGKLALESGNWVDCPQNWRAPFLPASKGAWADYTPLDEFFVYNGSGVMPGRTWIIAPDAGSLRNRWEDLKNAPSERKEELFHPHLAKNGLGDRHVNRKVENGLAGHEARDISVAEDGGECVQPVRYGYRSFDRQWIIPDNRLINRPNPELWKLSSANQVFLTAPSDTSPSNGPALTLSALIPDLHHYHGRGGRVFPLWRDAAATRSNVRTALLRFLEKSYGNPIPAEDVMAYISAVAANPHFTERFESDLVQPGIRVPLTADAALFAEAVRLGREVVWLHCFGERLVDASEERPFGPPRLPEGEKPFIPEAGAVPSDSMPNTMDYDESSRKLIIGNGFIENVSPEVWNYEVSGKHVLRQWFSYRKADRTRPLMGDRRPPSKLGNIQPEQWPAEYTTELLNVINVLGRLVRLEPHQADLLGRICSGPLISFEELKSNGALTKDDSGVAESRAEPLLDGLGD